MKRIFVIEGIEIDENESGGEGEPMRCLHYTEYTSTMFQLLPLSVNSRNVSISQSIANNIAKIIDTHDERPLRFRSQRTSSPPPPRTEVGRGERGKQRLRDDERNTGVSRRRFDERVVGWRAKDEALVRTDFGAFAFRQSGRNSRAVDSTYTAPEKPAPHCNTGQRIATDSVKGGPGRNGLASDQHF